MIKYTLINIKNSLKSKYFVLGILLVLGTFFPASDRENSVFSNRKNHYYFRNFYVIRRKNLRKIYLFIIVRQYFLMG